MTIIQIIKERIEERGITYAELARRLEIPNSKLYNSLKNNPTRTLRPTEFVKIAHFLQLDIDAMWQEACYEDTNEQNQSA